MDTVKLDEWKLFSSRPSSDNYFDADEKILLKVFKEKGEQVLDNVQKEKTIADYVAGLGIKTPAVYDILQTEDGRLCVTYEYIKDKKSLIRAVSEDLSLAEPYMQKLAEIGKLIHSKKCDAVWAPDYRSQALANIALLDNTTEDIRNGIEAFLKNLPDADFCLHGDFQPGNFITANGETYAIDLGEFGKGHYMSDISQFFMLTHFIHEEGMERIFHMSPDQARKCWQLFAEAYFEGNIPPEIEFVKFSLVGLLSHLHLFPISKPHIIDVYTKFLAQ